MPHHSPWRFDPGRGPPDQGPDVVRVTMEDVARSARVSASTVCRALRNDLCISVKTRAKVRMAAESLGYEPDPLLSAFASRRRGRSEGIDVTTIAYVTKFPSESVWRENPYYRKLFEGACSRAQQSGYRLEHFWMGEPGMSAARFSQILYSRGISAILVAPTPGVRGHLSLDWSRFSCVTVGYSLLRPNIHRASSHHFHGMLTAVRELRRIGYRRIGFCLHRATSKRVDEQWLAGFLACQRLLTNVQLALCVFNDQTVSRIPAWCRREKLEVVIGAEPIVLDQLQQKEMFPGEVDFASGSWDDTKPEIAGFDQRPGEIGGTAIDLLVGQLQRGERGIPKVPLSTLVEGQWRGGSSLGRYS